MNEQEGRVTRFTDSVTDFKGLYVKDADKQIIKHLKEKGRLVHAGTVGQYKAILLTAVLEEYVL